MLKIRIRIGLFVAEGKQWNWTPESDDFLELHGDRFSEDGAPRQLTFGTENEDATSVSTTGMVAVHSSKDFSDFTCYRSTSPRDKPQGRPGVKRRTAAKNIFG
jgi:hypothetical protein